MEQLLLDTKFYFPAHRAGEIDRPRLLDQLTSGLAERRKLSLISAPAGYGKTTLTAEWLYQVRDRIRPAWLSLEEADNDLARFLHYWVSSFRKVDKTIGSVTLGLLRSPNIPVPSAVIDPLLNELSQQATQIVGVLDDYHVITNPVIQDVVEYFIDHQPAQVHLVILTRADPPLPLARLRARRQLTELRARDLRFTLEEAQTFFEAAAKMSLDPEIVEVIEKRCEGWAAGLQLAALALQNQPAPGAFIETFRGSHRYVLDYLAEEVVHQQGEEIRRFLVQTSVLEKFNSSLCGALTGRADSQNLLNWLEQAGMFIIPLDSERNWYRYHHLFAEYLRLNLTEAETQELSRKAAVWYEENRLMFEAVQYALASGDLAFAADMMERAVQMESTWSSGELSRLTRWLDALPEHVLQSRPLLSLHASRILYLSGRFDQAESLLDRVEHNLSESDLPESETSQLLAIAALYRGSIAAVRGSFQVAVEQTKFAQARIPPENHLAHARGFFSLGLAYEISDQTDLAVHNYLQSSEEALLAGVLFLAIHARCAAAQVQIKQGKLNLAEQTCQSAVRLAKGERLPPLGLAWIVLGGIALERNDLASAEQLLWDGVNLSREGGLLDEVVLGWSLLTHWYAVQGDFESAYGIFRDIHSILQTYGVERMSSLASAYLARLQLSAGDAPAAAQWANHYLISRGNSPQDYEDLTLVRCLLSEHNLEEVPVILNPILEKAQKAGRNRTLIEGMILRARFLQASNDSSAALDALSQALRLASPEGFIRIFLDEGSVLTDLLVKARAAAPEFVDNLLQYVAPLSKSVPPSIAGLPDPLSEQEQKVLRLIVAGKSNREIAEDLVITVGTAKWHVHNILQKLGVNSRAQAIARARELGF